MATTAHAYDRIGVGYAAHRQPDPRIAASIERALGPVRRIINVGAGTGSYEPSTARCEILAVEPSQVMVRQRPATVAPVVRAVGEALPFPDQAFDAAMAVLTLHHWPDPLAGLAEMVRVAPRRVVFTFDPPVHNGFWLLDEYFPGIKALIDTCLPLADVASALGSDGTAVTVETVPIPADCIDGFLWAFWQRPEAYLDPSIRAASSGLSLLPHDEVARGVTRLSADLSSGRWHERHADLLDLDEIDGGFRLVVAG